jgi:hypothetical protein
MTDIARRTVADRAVVSYVDYFDQPKGPLLLVMECGQSVLFSIDSVAVDEKCTTGFLNGDLVVQFSSALPWYVLPVNYVDVRTVEKATEDRITDDKQLEEMHKKFHGCDKKDEAHIPIGQYA